MADAPGIVIAAPSSGAGKTLVTLGLLRALARAGTRVSSAKAGPDYIDPRFHAAASGRPCVNLDAWAMRAELVSTLAHTAARDADLLIVEGVMGLFDGVADPASAAGTAGAGGARAGAGSTAQLAKQLGLPVVLVVDAKAQAQSAAALVHGFATYDPGCRIAGAILNRVGSERHEALLRAALDAIAMPVLGAVRQVADIAMPSRHLGLVQAGEHAATGGLDGLLDAAADAVGAGVDLDALAGCAQKLDDAKAEAHSLTPLGGRIAVASDAAFTFAYPHLLDGWRAAGAGIVPFSPLAGELPDPQADAIFLPGGYPELHAGPLAACAAIREGLKRAAARGALIYGECGGFMVLGETLQDADGHVHPMAGLLPVATSFATRKLTLGYRRLAHTSPLPFPATLTGHEFHYSTHRATGDAAPLFAASDAAGTALPPLGMARGRVMGSYAHVIDTGTP